ncbi:MAG: hypothetical protein WBY44_00430 [Bryobacteraceae bacterium]
MEHLEQPAIRKKSYRRPASDPKGFLGLTQYPWGEFHTQWCKSDSGAEISKRNSAGNHAFPGSGCEVFIIPVSDLLAWRKSGLDELEALGIL